VEPVAFRATEYRQVENTTSRPVFSRWFFEIATHTPDRSISVMAIIENYAMTAGSDAGKRLIDMRQSRAAISNQRGPNLVGGIEHDDERQNFCHGATVLPVGFRG
jgi:hypothetical protein